MPNKKNLTTSMEVVSIFKRQAKGFIKWVCQSDEQTAGTHRTAWKQINKAKTFEDVCKVLSDYDHDGLFVSMVRKGYF